MEVDDCRERELLDDDGFRCGMTGKSASVRAVGRSGDNREEGLGGLYALTLIWCCDLDMFVPWPPKFKVRLDNGAR